MNTSQVKILPRTPLSWRLALGCLGLSILTGLALILMLRSAIIIFGLAGIACCFFTVIAYLNDLRIWLMAKSRPRGHGIYLLLAPFIGPLAGLLVFYVMLTTALAAQMRSKVSRCRADMRTTTMAIDAYYQQHNAYPAWSADRALNAFGYLNDSTRTLKNLPTFTMRHGTQLVTLTTPFAYITSYHAEFFSDIKGAPFCYWTPPTSSRTTPGYILWSPGPDTVYDLTIDNVTWAYDPASTIPSPLLINLTYDPSNGTNSRGDIYRTKQ